MPLVQQLDEIQLLLQAAKERAVLFNFSERIVERIRLIQRTLEYTIDLVKEEIMKETDGKTQKET